MPGVRAKCGVIIRARGAAKSNPERRSVRGKHRRERFRGVRMENGFDASEIDASASVDDVQNSGDRWHHTIPSGRHWRRPRLEPMKPRIWQTFWRAARTYLGRRSAEETKPMPRARTDGCLIKGRRISDFDSLLDSGKYLGGRRATERTRRRGNGWSEGTSGVVTTSHLTSTIVSGSHGPPRTSGVRTEFAELPVSGPPGSSRARTPHVRLA